MSIPRRITFTAEELRGPLSTDELAKRHGCSRAWAWKQRKAAGVPTPHGPIPVIIPEEALREQVTARALAKRFGCSEQTICERRKKIGFRLDTAPEPRPLPVCDHHPSPDEIMALTLLGYYWPQAKRQGVAWGEFLISFREELPALMNAAEYRGSTVRIRTVLGGAA